MRLRYLTLGNQNLNTEFFCDKLLLNSKYRHFGINGFRFLMGPMKFRLISAILFILIPKIVWAVECIGPKNSKNSIVYLHGMDTPTPGEQEILIRQKLTTISEKLNLRLALPRATKMCPTNAKLMCWGWDFSNSKIIDEALASAFLAAKECFPQAKKLGLIGFSNGGLVVNQIVKDCKETPFSWFISVGAAGSWKKNETKNLKECGTLYLFAGKQDKSNYLNIKNFSAWFKSQGANTELVEHDGGHAVPSEELERLLRKLTNNSSADSKNK